jgi:predicted Holliday junction resolvase-like endonuclease
VNPPADESSDQLKETNIIIGLVVVIPIVVVLITIMIATLICCMRNKRLFDRSMNITMNIMEVNSYVMERDISESLLGNDKKEKKEKKDNEEEKEKSLEEKKMEHLKGHKRVLSGLASFFKGFDLYVFVCVCTHLYMLCT